MKFFWVILGIIKGGVITWIILKNRMAEKNRILQEKNQTLTAKNY